MSRGLPNRLLKLIQGFLLKPSPELAYIIGVVAGDGSACKISIRSGQYVIDARAKDRELIEEFARCLGKFSAGVRRGQQ